MIEKKAVLNLKYIFVKPKMSIVSKFFI